MSSLNASLRDISRPASIVQLPIDDRGFPVPWFVDYRNGKPDHRVADARKLVRAVKEKRCWICGVKLGRMSASVIGPMCCVNRITSEPPAHPLCAHYAIAACPFLSKPRARRNEKDLPEDRRDAAGLPIDRNPGVLVIWESLHPSKPFHPQYGNSGVLFNLGAPHRVTWWREGRPATREEVEEALATGLPALAAIAVAEGQEAIDTLAEATKKVEALFPAETA